MKMSDSKTMRRRKKIVVEKKVKSFTKKNMDMLCNIQKE